MTNGLEEHSRAEVCDKNDEKQRERREVNEWVREMNMMNGKRDIARKKDMIGEKRKEERDRRRSD
jgi:hypothetical protein